MSVGMGRRQRRTKRDDGRRCTASVSSRPRASAPGSEACTRKVRPRSGPSDDVMACTPSIPAPAPSAAKGRTRTSVWAAGLRRPPCTGALRLFAGLQGWECACPRCSSARGGVCAPWTSPATSRFVSAPSLSRRSCKFALPLCFNLSPSLCRAHGICATVRVYSSSRIADVPCSEVANGGGSDCLTLLSSLVFSFPPVPIPCCALKQRCSRRPSRASFMVSLCPCPASCLIAMHISCRDIHLALALTVMG